MTLAPHIHRLVAAVLAAAMLTGSMGATGRIACSEACPCCQARKASGDRDGCCGGLHKQSRSCCERHPATSAPKRSCCPRHDAQPVASTSTPATTPDRPLCLCGAPEREPVLPSAFVTRAADEIVQAVDVTCAVCIAAPPCAVAAVSRCVETRGAPSALALRAVLCCWRI